MSNLSKYKDRFEHDKNRIDRQVDKHKYSLRTLLQLPLVKYKLVTIQTF